MINRHMPLTRIRIKRGADITSTMRAIMVLLASIGLSAAIVLAILIDTLAPAALAAPSGAGFAQHTINALQADGYNVIVNKVGSAPLGQCTVTPVHPGRQTHPHVSPRSTSHRATVHGPDAISRARAASSAI
jgi:hypothetical protein